MRKFLVLLAAAAFVFAVSAPSFAAEWSFYGSARVGTFYNWVDYKDQYNSPDPAGNGLTDDKDTDYDQYLQGNSRIGARVKVTDNLSGRFEYGSGPNLRLLFGEYDFGGWKLQVGQDYTPLNHFPSNQVFGGDTDLLPYGGFYQGRQPMIQFKFGNLGIAFVDSYTAGTGPDIEDTDVIMPILAAEYIFRQESFLLKLAGGYQTFNIVDNDDNDEDISSYILYVGAEIPLGALYVNAGGWYGQNTGNLGMWQIINNNATVNVGDAVNNLDYNVDDVTAYGLLGVVGWRMSDMLKFEGGAGYTANNPDANGLEDEKLYSWYVQAEITLAKGVYITPELGQVVYDTTAADNDGPVTTYFGAKWQINF